MESLAVGRAGDFVLDEGLEDEDEEMLAFEADRKATDEAGSDSKVSGTAGVSDDVKRDAETNDEIPKQEDVFKSFPDAVVVDGMPSDANRAHLEAFLDGCGEIVALKVYRFPDKTLAARVQFVNESSANAALAKNGSAFMRKTSPVSVLTAPSNWDDFIASHPSKLLSGPHLGGRSREGSPISPGTRGAVMVGGIPVNLSEALLKPEDMKTALWNAFGSARKAAEVFEERARSAGKELDAKLQFSENVDEASKRSRVVMENMDAKYKMREKITVAVVAGKEKAGAAAEGAKSVDQSLGVSRRLASVSTSIAQAGSKAAHEVDENFRVTDRARGVANSALEHERIGPAVRQAMQQWDQLWASWSSASNGDHSHSRKKNYVSRGVEQDLTDFNTGGDDSANTEVPIISGDSLTGAHAEAKDTNTDIEKSDPVIE